MKEEMGGTSLLLPTLTLEYASRHTNKQLKFKWSNSWALVCVRGTDQAVKALSTHIDIQTFTWYLTIKLHVYMIIGIALGIWINLKVLCISCTFVLQTLNCASSDEKCTIGHFWIIWLKCLLYGEYKGQKTLKKPWTWIKGKNQAIYCIHCHSKVRGQ